MRKSKYKYRIAILILALLLPMIGYSQSVLEFGSVKLIQGSFLVPAGTNQASIPVRDTTLVIPAGKVWKFDAIKSGFGQDTFDEINFTSFLHVSINDCAVFTGGGAIPMFDPFWLPAGNYRLSYFLTATGTPSVPHYFKFFLSVLEYSTVP